MPKIIVNPVELEKKAGEIGRLSERLSKLTGRISSVCLLAGSYDGQFKPRVVQLAGHMNSKIMQSSTRTSGSSKKLQNISKRFLEADGQFGSSSANTSFMDRLQEIVGGIIGGFGPGIITQLGLIASLGTVFTLPNMPWNPWNIVIIGNIAGFFASLFYGVFPNKSPESIAPVETREIEVENGEIHDAVQMHIVPAQGPFKEGYTERGGFPIYMDNVTHNGVDLIPKQPSDKSIYPIGPGKVVECVIKNKNGSYTTLSGAKPLYNLGNYVIVEHRLENGKTIYTTYAHMSESVEFNINDPVDLTTRIGTMGGNKLPGPPKTGDYAPHLHLTVQNVPPGTQGIFGSILKKIKGYDKTEGITKKLINDNPDLRKLLEHWIDPRDVMNNKDGGYNFVHFDSWEKKM